MTINLKRPAFIWGLLLCIALVNGLMTASSVGHAEHHAHHQTGTHTTGICAWLCAAGQDIESSSVALISRLQLVERVVVTPFDVVLIPILFSHFLRGPPVFLS